MIRVNLIKPKWQGRLTLEAIEEILWSIIADIKVEKFMKMMKGDKK